MRRGLLIATLGSNGGTSAPNPAESSIAHVELTSATGTLLFTATGDADYSVDGGSTWTAATSGVEVSQVATNVNCYIRQTDSGTTVTNISFNGCSDLKIAHKFDRTGWTDLYRTFQDCTSLETVSNLTTTGANYFRQAFNGCTSLLAVPNMDSSLSTDFREAFRDCTSLTSVSNLDVSNGERFDEMFRDCTGLVTVSNFNTSKGTIFDSCFRGCTLLSAVPSGLDTSLATSLSNLFNLCHGLTEVSTLDTGNCTNFVSTFASCSSLVTVSNLDTSSGENFTTMFSHCTSLETISCLNTTSATSTLLIFNNTGSLTSPDAATRTLLTAEGGFNACVDALAHLELTSATGTLLFTPTGDVDYSVDGGDTWTAATSGVQVNQAATDTWCYIRQTSGGTAISGITFNSMTDLKSVNKLDMTGITSAYRLFISCSNLESIRNFNTTGVTSMRETFEETAILFPPDMDTSLVTDFRDCFKACSELTVVDNVDVSAAETVSGMFNNCSDLTHVYNLDTSNSEEFGLMFQLCTSLLVVNELNTTNVADASSNSLLFYLANASLAHPTAAEITLLEVDNVGYDYKWNEIFNGNFGLGLTGWENPSGYEFDTIEVTGGRLHLESSDTDYKIARTIEANEFTLTAGVDYEMTFDYEVISGQITASSIWIRDNNVNNYYYDTTLTGSGSASFQFTATTTETLCDFRIDVGEANEFYLDNISVKEV